MGDPTPAQLELAFGNLAKAVDEAYRSLRQPPNECMLLDLLLSRVTVPVFEVFIDGQSMAWAGTWAYYTAMPDVLLGQLQQLVGELREGFQRLEVLVQPRILAMTIVDM
jgi:hypothetical protein